MEYPPAFCPSKNHPSFLFPPGSRRYDLPPCIFPSDLFFLSLSSLDAASKVGLEFPLTARDVFHVPPQFPPPCPESPDFSFRCLDSKSFFFRSVDWFSPPPTLLTTLGGVVLRQSSLPPLFFVTGSDGFFCRAFQTSAPHFLCS